MVRNDCLCAARVVFFIFCKTSGEIIMEKNNSKSDMPMKTAEVKKGKTTYIIECFNCGFDEKAVKSKIARLIKNETAKKTFSGSFFM